MSIIKQISSSIKTKKMTLEEKIQYLENLEQNGIQIANLPINYISKDGIIINNVLINIRKYYFKNLMTVEQTIRCENLKVKLDNNDVTTDFKINFLKKAIKEGYDLIQILTEFEKYKNNSIYKYIEELRNLYENNNLTPSQIEECINELKIIIPIDQRKDIALKIIRNSALKNIIESKQIISSLM